MCIKAYLTLFFNKRTEGGMSDCFFLDEGKMILDERQK